MAESVKRPTSAQAMISQFVGSSPTSGSVLTAQSLEPASDSVSPSLSVLPPFTLCPSLLQNYINIKKNVKERTETKYNGVPGWFSWLSLQLLIWAQVMISGFMSSSPTSGSVLTAQSLELLRIL